MSFAAQSLWYCDGLVMAAWLCVANARCCSHRTNLFKGQVLAGNATELGNRCSLSSLPTLANTFFESSNV